MNIEEIKTYLEENKDNQEVVEFINSYKTPLNLENVMEFCTTDKGAKSWVDSMCDKYATKAVNTARENAIAKFKEEELPKILEQEIKNYDNKGLTPEQIALKEMESKYQALEKQIKMKELESKYKDTLSQKGLDTRLMKYILSENEDDITANIDLFSEIISSATNTEVNKRLSDSSYTPPQNITIPKRMSKKELLSKGYAFISNFESEHPEEYKEIMAAN